MIMANPAKTECHHLRLSNTWMRSWSILLLSLLISSCAGVQGAPHCPSMVGPSMDVESDALETSRGSLPELEALSCDLEPTLRSVRGVVPTVLRLENGRAETLQLFWLDYEGKRKSYGSVAPASIREMRTFLTHPWVLVSPSGACVEILLPRAARFHATIR